MPRTIVDLLKRGNQELFYSAMLAWLLDPREEEHGLGDRFLRGFISAARSEGIEIPEDGWERPEVHGEFPERRSRYDIMVQSSHGHSFVVENKTKSVGAEAQIRTYEDAGHTVVPLGLSRVSFIGTDNSLTYRAVRDLLQDLREVPDDAFGHLVRHFRDHLDHELARLDYVHDLASGKCDLSARDELMRQSREGELGENELRLLNLIFLYLVRPELTKGRLEGCRWHGNKNQKSGAWLATKRNFPPTRFEWSQEIRSSLNPEYLWFHIELHQGILHACEGGEEKEAGEIQIRAKSVEGQSNKEMYSLLKSASTSADSTRFSRRPANSYKTFKVAAQPITGDQLSTRGIKTALLQFMEVFGRFV